MAVSRSEKKKESKVEINIINMELDNNHELTSSFSSSSIKVAAKAHTSLLNQASELDVGTSLSIDIKPEEKKSTAKSKSQLPFNIEIVANLVLNIRPTFLWNLLIQHIPSNYKTSTILKIINQKYKNKSLLQHIVDMHIEYHNKKRRLKKEIKGETTIEFSEKNYLRDIYLLTNILVSFGAQDKVAKLTLQTYTDEFAYSDEDYRIGDDLVIDYIYHYDKALRHIFMTMTNPHELKKFFLYAKNLKQYETHGMHRHENEFQSYISHLDEQTQAIHTNKIVEWINKKWSKANFIQDFNFLSRRIKLFPALNECACTPFERTAHDRRETLEFQIIKNTLEFYPPDSKDFTLKYLSLGAGGLLSDFIIIWKLMAHYKNLKIILIDPTIDKDALIQFKLLYCAALELGIKISIHHYKTIYEYQEAWPELEIEKPHVINGIDFTDIFEEEVFKDVIQAHQVMDENGMFYLSLPLYDFCFSKKQCLSMKSYKINPMLDSIEQKLKDEKAIQAKEIIHYASLTPFFCLEEWVKFIPKIIGSECKEVNITQIKPCIFKDDLPTENINKHFEEKNIAHFLKLFLPENININIKFIDSVKHFQDEYQNKQLKYDVITLLNFHLPDIKEAQAVIDWLELEMSDSIKCYRVFAGNKSTLAKIKEGYENTIKLSSYKKCF